MSAVMNAAVGVDPSGAPTQAHVAQLSWHTTPDQDMDCAVCVQTAKCRPQTPAYGLPKAGRAEGAVSGLAPISLCTPRPPSNPPPLMSGRSTPRGGLQRGGGGTCALALSCT